MRVDQLEGALREVAATQEPVAPGLQAVQRRRRRRSASQIGLALVVVLAVGASVLVWQPWEHSQTGLRVVTKPTPTGRLGPAVAKCFPRLAAARPIPATDPGMRLWLPDHKLLRLTSDGRILVSDKQAVAEWTTAPAGHPGAPGYLWARWAPDGSIFASRVVTDEVVIDRLTGPGRAKVLLTLPFTVKPDAPAGYSAIDGYLAAFSLSRTGLVLVKHRAGPFPIVCPAPFPSGAEHTCTPLPEAFGLEVRAANYRNAGVVVPGGYGGIPPTPIMADSPTGPALVLNTGAAEATLLQLDQPACCGPTPPPGTVYGLSRDAEQIAWAGPDGRALSVAPLGTLTIPAGQTWTPPPPIWASPDPITAIAWSGDWLAIAHGGKLALVFLREKDGTKFVWSDAAVANGVRTLDWSG